jgi:hypothetical protein
MFIGFGNRGKRHGTYSIKFPEICSRNLFSIRNDGRMEVPFGAMGKTAQDRTGRDRLKAILADSMHLPVPDDYEARYPGYRLEQWGPELSTLVGELQATLSATGDQESLS